MGLDMYLYRKHYVKNWDHMDKKDLHSILVKKDGKKVDYINPEKISYIEEDVAYWRKANQIHKWFVDNVQDGEDNCGTYYVGEDQLKKLLDMCKEVLKASELVDGKINNGKQMQDGKLVDIKADGKYIKDPKVAEDLLPTGEGFFFGGTDYDEYYIEDLKETIKQLEEALKNGHGDYYYHSSW